ncbi:nucleotidyltransferase domain-containing protein [Clostridium butyricum]|uniref:DNA polymerase III subunit beta n=1 Tax=Clostridium butyricum TaxID=1492 RepID=A0A2S7FEE8_CLOBU|nr:nucleotidyltransferase domain-containing protein [Clostridium butyricum]KHD15048.1 DNA polymerase III subunit beta [Clostridium butyricum]PPV17417.1 DNA polymerase III subunit beta [Clostridium butyricum]
MLKAILNYQKASEKLINSLQTNRKVLAVFAFGSIVNGDLWEESDIDIFVVYKDQFYNMRDVYSEILDIPVHMKILNKEKFLELYENNGKKGEIRNMLTSSKLVFSRDEEIDILFNKAKYSMDKFVEIWNLVYLGKLIKDLGVTKKYLYNDRLFTSFEVLIRALDSFAKLYLNISGYTVSRDAIKMTMNLNNKFNRLVENLIEKELKQEYISSIVEYIDDYLADNISIAAKFLLNYLEEKKTYLSSYEIKSDEIFSQFDIKIEDILKELFKNGFIEKNSRKIELPAREKLLNENVYAYRKYK